MRIFDQDKFYEILSTISQNKLRTLLTAFSVAWGIFMLIILLGAGNGLVNGFKKSFSDDAINSIWIRAGQTSMPYEGIKPGRYLQFKNEDYEFIKKLIPDLKESTARFNRGNSLISHKSNSGNYFLRAVHPDHQYLENSLIDRGRFINPNDLTDFKKVIVLGKQVVDELFPKNDPIGNYVNVSGVNFKVVGTFRDIGSEWEESIVYVPITTAQRAFKGGDKINRMIFSTGDASLEETIQYAERIKLALSKRHHFHPDDERAVYVRNITENFQKIMNVLRAIEAFIWIIGMMTIVAGVVGIGNIMMISVKERTREIGIRKALGATPFSVISIILQESILITAIAGYIGMFVGIFLLEFISSKIPDGDIFRNPEIDLSTALISTLVLVVAGTVAGFIPARNAAMIKPIDALRDE